VINIFVRNLDPTTTETQLRELFAAYGSVESVSIVQDRDTQGPRGFAFVEMTDVSAAQTAIQSLSGFRLNDRELRLNEARAKDEQDPAQDASREHRRHRI
jgi:RNA recognition motif-containing protein